MKKFYISALFLIALFCTQKTTAQIACNASFYIDSVASTPFNAVIVNNSTFTPALTPPDSGIYIWMWGDGTSSVSRYPTHTYTSAGSKTIYLQVENTTKTCHDSMVKVITIDTNGGFHKTNAAYTVRVVAVGAAQGIASSQSKAFVTMTPNVIKDYAKLNFSGMNRDVEVNAEVYSYDGKNVLSVNEQLNNNTMQLQTSTLKSGMYFVYVTAGDQTTLIKFVKQ